jgi:hypothetical protein
VDFFVSEEIVLQAKAIVEWSCLKIWTRFFVTYRDIALDLVAIPANHPYNNPTL